jgi:hypothetical protein
MTGLAPARISRLMSQVLRLLYRPKPSYEFFIDVDGRTAWFAMLCFPRYEEWDAYALIKVLKQMLRDIAATSRQMNDPRSALLLNRLITLLDIALQTEPMEGEATDGRLHDDT